MLDWLSAAAHNAHADQAGAEQRQARRLWDRRRHRRCHKAVYGAGAADIVSHDLSCIVDAGGLGGACRQWVIDGGETAVGVHEAVVAAGGVVVISRDLSR